MLPTFCRGTREHPYMIKILSFGRSCKAYFRLYRSDGSHMKLCCDHCSHSLHKHGRYYRWVTTKRETFQIPIYRWLCPHCRTTVHYCPIRQPYSIKPLFTIHFITPFVKRIFLLIKRFLSPNVYVFIVSSHFTLKVPAALENLKFYFS